MAKKMRALRQEEEKNMEDVNLPDDVDATPLDKVIEEFDTDPIHETDGVIDSGDTYREGVDKDGSDG